MSAVAPINRPSGKARLTNKFHKEHREMFRGQEIVIPAGGHIDMDYFDAVSFRGQYFPFAKNEAGTILKCKALDLEILSMSDTVAPQFLSHADGKVFLSESELEAHLKTLEGNFVAVKDEKLDRELAADAKKSDDTLAKILSAVTSLAERIETLESKGKKKRDTVRNNHSSEASQ